MCTHTRYVYNPYIGESVRVSCGRCKSCLQERALNRANRIRLNYKIGYIPIFCTFTYDNDSIPYIKREHLTCLTSEDSRLSVPVYRRARIFAGNRIKSDETLIDVVSLDIPQDGFDLNYLKGLKKANHCISVCYYPDIQNFIKRFRINLQRHYEINNPDFSYFICSEYGGCSQRAHFHALLFVPSSDFATYKRCISESWPYGNKYADKRELDKCYSVVRKDAASYISSYVNSGNRLSSILQSREIRQSHSYSKGFGCSSDYFTLSTLLDSVSTGDMSYCKQVIVDGVPAISNFPLPKYFINRYFPMYKGFSQLSADEILRLALQPRAIRQMPVYHLVDYHPNDLHKVVVRIDNCADMFTRLTGLGRYDFAYYYSRVWSVYKSYLLKHSFDDIGCKADYLDHYINIADYVYGVVSSPSLDVLGYDKSDYCTDFNKSRFLVQKTYRLEQLYDKLCKQRDVTNIVLSQTIDV